MRAFNKILAIMAIVPSLSYGGWRGGYASGQVNVANGGKIVFANGTELTGDTGAAFIVNDGTANRVTITSGGQTAFLDNGGTQQVRVDSSGVSKSAGVDLLLSQGLDVPTGETVAFANGGSISGDSGANLKIISTGTDDIDFEVAGVTGAWNIDAATGDLTPAFAYNVGTAGRPTGTVNVGSGDSLTFANGSTISGDSGADTIVTMGSGQNWDIVEHADEGGHLRETITASGSNVWYPSDGGAELLVENAGVSRNGVAALELVDGANMAAETAITWDGGASIYEDTTDRLNLKAGTDAGDDILLREGDGDGGDIRFAVNGAGTVAMYNPSGTVKVTLQENMAIANGNSLSVSDIIGFAGSDLTIRAGSTAGDDVVIAEGSGDGSNQRLRVAGGGDIQFRDTAATLVAHVDAGGIDMAAELAITWDGGASIYEGASDDLNIKAGTDTGDQVRIRESDADGGSLRFLVGDASTVLYSVTGSALWTWGSNSTISSGNLYANGATIEDVQFLELDAISGVSSPADGHVRIWAPLDASVASDNVLQIEDQAGTAADFTHAAIDIEAP